MNALRFTLVAACLLVGTPVARADVGAATPGNAGFVPRVPVSALGRPAFGLDPSRLKIATSLSFGTFGSQASGLQVTSFSYQFQMPLWMNVNLGSTWGGGASSRGANGQFFLEGLDLAFRPSSAFMINVSYRDLRSPLQYGYGYGYDSPFRGTRNPYAP